MRLWKTRRAPKGVAIGPSTGCYPSRWLLQAQMFALGLAQHRGSGQMELQDFLGGVFLASGEFPELRGYWANFSPFAELATSLCGPLNDWRSSYRPQADMVGIPRSAELQGAVSAAEELAGQGSTRRMGLPRLTLEHVLYILGSRSTGLRETGIDMEKLRDAVLPRDAPRRSPGAGTAPGEV